MANAKLEEQIIKGVHGVCELTAEEKTEADEEFAKWSGGKDSFTMEEYKKYASNLLDRRYGTGPSNRKTTVLKNKMEMMTEKDLNNDGNITKEEYMIVEKFSKLDDNIREYGSNLFDPDSDDIMDLGEFESWLTECCKITDDAKTAAQTATKMFLPEGETELKITGFIKNLFAKAYPSKA